MRMSGLRNIVLLWLMLCVQAQAADSVSLQLRWLHQAQFAGYYMALEKGIYERAGLDVSIMPADPHNPHPLDKVISGQSAFGIGNAGLVAAYLQGQPVVALASIFQRSPNVWLVLKSSQIRDLIDLAQSRLMMTSSVENAELLAMFQHAGMDIHQLKIKPSSFNINDLIEHKTDAFNAYVTNEPFYLLEKDIPYAVFDPHHYGIDFYSDVLFTSQQLVQKNPELVERFVNASLEGWQYALNNMQETAVLIEQKYNDQHKSSAHIAYELSAVKQIIMPDLIKLGHMNPDRWVKIARTFREVGLISQDPVNLEGFLWHADSARSMPYWVTWVLYGLLAALVLAMLFVVLLRRHNTLLVHQATHDALTNLPNRLLLSDRLQQAISTAERQDKYVAVLFFDLDGFKPVNDRYGHAVGDRLLIEIATRLRAGIRPMDTVARIGGDEFVLVLCCVDFDVIDAMAARIIEQVSEPYQVGNEQVQVGASVGVAVFPNDATEAEQLIRHADHAMYHAKQVGKNQVCYWYKVQSTLERFSQQVIQC